MTLADFILHFLIGLFIGILPLLASGVSFFPHKYRKEPFDWWRKIDLPEETYECGCGAVSTPNERIEFATEACCAKCAGIAK